MSTGNSQSWWVQSIRRIGPSLLIAIVSFCVGVWFPPPSTLTLHQQKESTNGNDDPSLVVSDAKMMNDGQDANTDDETQSARNEHATYAIGDLHGDVTCAREWVYRTGLVTGNFSADDPNTWTWVDESSALIFMGDYIDKGPTSKQTLEFVKILTERFPDRVTALMGNHELELLKDRDFAKRYPYFYYQLPYATVHPREYLNFVRDKRDLDDIDELVIDLLYNASIEVYGHDHYTLAQFTTPSNSAPDATPITDYVRPLAYRKLVSERLDSYQQTYVDAFRSNTDLGKWTERRPIVHLTKDGTLFVHGGIGELGSDQLERGIIDVRRVNEEMATHAKERTLFDFLENTNTGRAVEEMIFYRENHVEYNPMACHDVTVLLDRMEGVERIAVGHTPDDSVRIECDGKFLALDSLLGRYIRAMGNDYCPVTAKEEGRRSTNGRYQCGKIGDVCEGQFVKIQKDGVVKVIDYRESST